MSIIDDALKGVERSQADSTDNLPESSLVAGGQSRRLPVVLGAGLIVIAAIAGGWWLVTSQEDSGSAVGIVPRVAEVTADSSDTGAQEGQTAVPATGVAVERAQSLDHEQVAELTTVVSGSEASIVESTIERTTVAELTEQEVGAETVSNGVSSLTAATAGSVDAVAALSTGDQQQLSDLTAVPDTGMVTGADDLSVTELTEDAGHTVSVDGVSAVEALTASAPEDSVADLTDRLPATTQSVVESVDGLTAITAVSDSQSPGAALNNDEVSALESVAGLTDINETDVRSPTGPSPAPASGDDVSGVSALTELTISASESATAPLDSTAAPIDSVVEKPVMPPVKVVVDTEVAFKNSVAAESRGDYSAALAALSGIESDAAEVTLLKARLLARVGKFEQSSALFVSVGETRLDANANFWLGFARFNLEQWQAAVAPLAKASAANVDDAIAPFYLGLALQQAGDYLGSIEAFHRARTLKPGMPEIAFNTGISWWALGEKGRALGAFRHFMRSTDGQRQTYAEQRRRVSQSYLGTAGNR